MKNETATELMLFQLYEEMATFAESKEDCEELVLKTLERYRQALRGARKISSAIPRNEDGWGRTISRPIGAPYGSR